MTQQLEMFTDATVPSPLCIWTPCTKQGRAVLGPEVRRGDCVNQSITCLTCHCTGWRSTNTAETRKGAA